MTSYLDFEAGVLTHSEVSDRVVAVEAFSGVFQTDDAVVDVFQLSHSIAQGTCNVGVCDLQSKP